MNVIMLVFPFDPDKLLELAEKKRCSQFSLSGAEPIMGRALAIHLAEVIRLIDALCGSWPMNFARAGPPANIMNYMKDDQISHVIFKPGKNDPCPCGSGLKYKKCHGKAG